MQFTEKLSQLNKKPFTFSGVVQNTVAEWTTTTTKNAIIGIRITWTLLFENSFPNFDNFDDK